MSRSNNADFGYEVGPIEAEGAFTSHFRFADPVEIDQVPALIESDRETMTTRPGMRHKLLPLLVDENNVNYSGGQYSFRSFEEAKEYKLWTEEEFRPNGILFWERDAFVDPVTDLWRIAGAEDFKDVFSAQTTVRFQKWKLSSTIPFERLEAFWPELRDRAREAGLSSCWWLGNEREGLIGLVTVGDRVERTDSGPEEPYSRTSLAWLKKQRVIKNHVLDDLEAEKKSFDRTAWIWTIWFPADATLAGDANSVWPNSDTLPGGSSEVQPTL